MTTDVLEAIHVGARARRAGCRSVSKLLQMIDGDFVNSKIPYLHLHRGGCTQGVSFPTICLGMNDVVKENRCLFFTGLQATFLAISLVPSGKPEINTSASTIPLSGICARISVYIVEVAKAVQNMPPKSSQANQPNQQLCQQPWKPHM